VSGRPDAAGLLDMVRPRITLLVGVQAAAGFLLERPDDLAPLPWLVGGTLLVSAAGCALNHWMERDADARMERTSRRPLVTGALSGRQVVGFGVGALAAGLALLAAGCPPLTIGLQALAAALYLGVYTPLKRRTSTNTWVGAIPGALPVLAGAAAAGHGLSGLSLCAFALVFLWQLPHFFAIASMYREQYARGGLRVLAGDDPGDRLLRWQLPVMVMSVLLVSMLPVLAGPARAPYAVTALLAGAAFLWSAFRFRARPERARARGVVLASVAYLPLVLGALVADVACVHHGGAPAELAAPADDGSGLPVLSALPEFELLDQDGRPLTRARLADGGEPWVVDFIFTSCAGICVPMTRGLVELQQSGLPARYLSVSVDPRVDSPDVLRAFRDKWQGDAQRWLLATGSHEQISRLGDEGFRLPVATGTTLTPEGYPDLFHSGRYALLDGRGRVRGTYEHGDSVEIERLRRDLAALRAAAAGGG
jgi:protoheme IX farnesyltransferase